MEYLLVLRVPAQMSAAEAVTVVHSKIIITACSLKKFMKLLLSSIFTSQELRSRPRGVGTTRPALRMASPSPPLDCELLKGRGYLSRLSRPGVLSCWAHILSSVRVSERVTQNSSWSDRVGSLRGFSFPKV